MKKACLLGCISMAALLMSAHVAGAQGTPGGAALAIARKDALEAGFIDPPASAKPRVWWHWIDGNITKDGIQKDLEWMKRSGIGGMTAFDGSFGVPTIVDKRVAYLSPEWKDAFHYSAQLADQLGLEMGVASSPGWSETGGPWVKPQDGMKKLVWSETDVEGGKPFAGRLAQPFATSGVYQDLGSFDALNDAATRSIPPYYADVAVLAYRISAPNVSSPPTYTLADGAALDGTVLTDNSFKSGVSVPRGTADAPTIIEINYATPQTIQSATVFIAGAASLFSPATIMPRLEVSADGQTWRKVADALLNIAPTTISFPPVTSAHFRVVLVPVLPDPGSKPTAALGYAGAASLGGAPTLSKTVSLRELSLSPEAKVNQFQAKAGFDIALDYTDLDGDVGPDISGIAAADVVDLSGRVQADGELTWTPPPGRWRIVRMGYSLTGAANHPAVKEATGLEVDKLDADAVRRYVETYLDYLKSATGDDLMGRRGLTALLSDSTEIGPFNWTPKLINQFQRLRGYDPRPWLPVLTGAIIGSRTQSDQFLFDFRRTISELHASEHYGTIAKVAHEHGLIRYNESNEGGRTSLGDDMDMRKYADVPMGAMWVFRGPETPKPSYLFDDRGAASVAHLYGQNLAAAESMTSTRFPWADAPWNLRRVVDAEFAEGINRITVHTSPHQPGDKAPGMSMRHIGQFFDRNESWADMAGPWVDYLARNSYMLQQGRFVADVAYFYGEEEPTPGLPGKDKYAGAPTRYGYDYVNASAVTDLLTVQGGDLVAPSGARYKVLYLSDSARQMTLPMLRRLAALVDAGATVVGSAPTGSPGLGADPAEYSALVHKLWSGEAVTAVGHGRVIAGKPVEAALATLGVKPDLQFNEAGASAEIKFVHRKLADKDIYFLANTQGHGQTVEAQFRVAGRVPEIWRADTGRFEPVSYRIDGETTFVPLQFDAYDSYFVVFGKPARVKSKEVAQIAPKTLVTLTGPWTVAFQPDRGAPASVTLPELDSLSANNDPAIKYFSGIATYARTFKMPPGYKRGQPLWLDLGQLGDLAEVHLNGKAIGTVWHAPYRINVAAALKPGVNKLDIRVADLWVNRLIGDAQPGAKKVTFTITPTYRADAPLRPSGLIGPVTLMTASREK